MQIVVLGMHRSGTSCVTGVLNAMGAYFGPDGIATDPHDQNPKGFWERRDMRALCDGALHAGGHDWWSVSDFDPAALPEDALGLARERFRVVLADLDRHRPWVVKEPRLCLLYPALRPMLGEPAVVLVHRDPLEVARSLAARDGFPVGFGVALWEFYNRMALRACGGRPVAVVSYRRLLADPAGELERLHAALRDAGAEGLHLPDRAAVDERVDRALHRNRAEPAEHAGWLNAPQLELHEALEARDVSAVSQTGLSAAAAELLRQFEADPRHGARVLGEKRVPGSARWDGFTAPSTRRAHTATPGAPLPAVDICMPAYNDERHVAEVIRCLQAQTYPDFHVHVIDDCSTDATWEVAVQATRGDSRFTLTRNPVNLGLVRNFRRAFDSGRSEFVMLKSSNDLLAPDYVDRLMALHLSYPRLGLAYSTACQLDDASRVAGEYPAEHYFRTDPAAPVLGARQIMSRYSNSAPLWGIARRSVLQLCRPYQFRHGGDHVLICEMALYAGIDYVDEPLLRRRVHPGRTVADLALLHAEDHNRLLPDDDAFRGQSFRLPFVDLAIAYLEMIDLARVTPECKAALYVAAGEILDRRFGRHMAAEIRRFEDYLATGPAALEDAGADTVLRRAQRERLLRVARDTLVVVPDAALEQLVRRYQQIGSPG